MDIATTLNSLREVVWDRFAGDPGGRCTIFGWIPRDDGRSDFVVLTFIGDDLMSFVTSSAKYSKEYGRRLFGNNNHRDCIRVEEVFTDVKNVVKL